ncbi:MAG: hypothetical protein KGJ86_18065, partial [Chloroflexota bacterium]|nr:hypothetical protein [Chloroflexota bacterium]
MGRIAGVFAMGHAPNLITTWDAAGPEVCQGVLNGCAEVAKRIRAAGATTLITIGNDHFNNFFLNNFPALCIGMADTWIGPEDDLRYEAVKIKGNAKLSRHIVEHLYEHEGFDPSLSYNLKLDHGTFVPVRFTFPEFELPLVPIFQNTVHPPMQPLQRSRQFGAALRRAIESYPADERVVVIGTGGISHFIGVPNQGYINEDFDHRVLDMMRAGDLEGLAGLSRAEVGAAGNGAEEIRNWIAAMSVAEGNKAEVIFYAAVPAWLIGVGIADFHYASSN